MLTTVTDDNRLITGLLARLATHLRAALRHRPRLLSLTLSAPGFCPSEPGTGIDPQIYWARPAAGELRIGTGRALAIETCGGARFGELERRFEPLRRDWLCLDPDHTGLGAQAFLGFAFDPADARFVVPSVLFQRRADVDALTFSHDLCAGPEEAQVLGLWSRGLSDLLRGPPAPSAPDPPWDPLRRVDCNPSAAQWTARVERALKAIRGGAMDKVVLTRRVRVERQRPLRIAGLLAWLEHHHPCSTNFALADGREVLVGASPERLAVLRRDRLTADALAGTAPRSPDPATDVQLGETLGANAKTRREHRLVVDDILRALDPLCTDLTDPGQPQVMRLPGVQHLWSPIQARVRPGVSLIGIAAALHPTAAVGGTPRRQALGWLARHEPEPRRWYTGALGWLGADGDGELAVVLRCALLQERSAELFAGSGIVADSDPAAELRETEWKLRTMLEALDAA